MEKNFPDGAAEDEAAAETQAQPEAKTENPVNTADDWQWDASVPETQTDNITFDDLGVVEFSATDETEEAAEAAEETAENAAEEIAEEKEETEEVSEAEAEETAETVEEKAPAYADDDGLCVVCGNPREDSPSDLYCKECREKFLRTDYGAGHIILAFLMILVAAVGYFVCSATGSIASDVRNAQKCLDSGNYSDAADACSKISEDTNTINTGINAVFSAVNSNFASKEWFGIGEKTNAIILESYADVVSISNGEHETFISSVESALTEAELAKPQYEKVKKVYDFCKELVASSEVYMGGMQEFISYNENGETKISYDKALKYLDGLGAESTAEKCMADYCRFLSAFYADKDADTILGFYDSLYETAGEFGYIFAQTYMDASAELDDYDRLETVATKVIERNANDSSAYYYLILANTNKGDYEIALANCEELKKSNPDNLEYYGMKAGILRRQGKFEEAVNLCKEGLAIGEDAEIYRQQAIAYMLLENQDSALEAVKQAYDITLQGAYAGEYVSIEVINTAAIISCICGDEETYNEIVDLFESEGVEFDKVVTDCVKGEITFEEIFMEGTGDV